MYLIYIYVPQFEWRFLAQEIQSKSVFAEQLRSDPLRDARWSRPWTFLCNDFSDCVRWDVATRIEDMAWSKDSGTPTSTIESS